MVALGGKGSQGVVAAWLGVEMDGLGCRNNSIATQYLHGEFYAFLVSIDELEVAAMLEGTRRSVTVTVSPMLAELNASRSHRLSSNAWPVSHPQPHPINGQAAMPICNGLLERTKPRENSYRNPESRLLPPNHDRSRTPIVSVEIRPRAPPATSEPPHPCQTRKTKLHLPPLFRPCWIQLIGGSSPLQMGVSRAARPWTGNTRRRPKNQVRSSRACDRGCVEARLQRTLAAASPPSVSACSNHPNKVPPAETWKAWVPRSPRWA